jgi:hypothetical protein
MADLLLISEKRGQQQEALKKLHRKEQLWHLFLAMGDTFEIFNSQNYGLIFPLALLCLITTGFSI